nr:HNH endonuclease [Morganella morganii]
MVLLLDCSNIFAVDFARADKIAGYSKQNPRPANYTWHHNTQDPTKIELTVRPQHQAPGPVQHSLHPSQEGGFKKLNDDY